MTALSVAPLIIAIVILVFGLPVVVKVYDSVARGDLSYIVSGGNVIMDHKPALLYANEHQEIYDGIIQGQEGGYGFPGSYPYAPTFALAMVPLAKSSHNLTARVWQVLTALSTLVLAGLVAAQFRGWSWRLLAVASVVCWEPLLINARIGQTGGLVAGLTALAFVVFLRNRKVGALLFGLLAFKPSAALAPFFLIFPESPRVWLRFYAVVGVVAAVPFIWLGPNALFGWIDILTNRAVIDLAGGHAYNQGITSIIDLKSPVGIFLIATTLLVLALTVATVEKRLDVAAAASLTVFLALLLNPHSLLYDWGVAFVGLLLLRRSTVFPERYADACAGALVLSLFVAGQIVWHEFRAGDILHLLTLWTLAMIAGLVTLTLSPSMREGLRTLPETLVREPRPVVATETVATAAPVSRRSSRSARRKSRG